MKERIKPIEALEAIDRINNYCEEIDWNIPENERTGYQMIRDVLLIRRFIYQQKSKDAFSLY